MLFGRCLNFIGGECSRCRDFVCDDCGRCLDFVGGDCGRCRDFVGGDRGAGDQKVLKNILYTKDIFLIWGNLIFNK